MNTIPTICDAATKRMQTMYAASGAGGPRLPENSGSLDPIHGARIAPATTLAIEPPTRRICARDPISNREGFHHHCTTHESARSTTTHASRCGAAPESFRKPGRGKRRPRLSRSTLGCLRLASSEDVFQSFRLRSFLHCTINNKTCVRTTLLAHPFTAETPCGALRASRRSHRPLRRVATISATPRHIPLL